VRCAAVEARTREQIRETLGIAETTLKTHVRNIAQKTGSGDLRDAVERVLREAM
jgi:ATP/maltotriose-dependent transcriptional regulator MalT